MNEDIYIAQYPAGEAIIGKLEELPPQAEMITFLHDDKSEETGTD